MMNRYLGDEVTPLLGMTEGNQQAPCTRERHSLKGRVNKKKRNSTHESLGTGPGNIERFSSSYDSDIERTMVR